MTTRSDSALLHFSRGIPPAEVIPADMLSEHAIDVVRDDPARVFQYAPLGRHQGDDRLRAQLAAFHLAEPDSIFVGNGSLQVLDLLADHLLRQGPPVVFTEAPTYDRAIQIFERHGAEVLGFPVEADGLDVDALREQVRSRRPAFVYTIPDFQNPSGAAMSTVKRRALAGLASEYDLTIVEDTPYRELRYHGEHSPALSELADHARVITLGSLSKVLSPGLRIGYAISDPETSTALAALAEATYLSPAPLCQSIAARCLASGMLRSNIDQIRDILRPRHDAAIATLRDAFGEALIAVPDGGYFVAVLLTLHGSESELISAARDEGVVLTRGSVFYPRSTGPGNGVVFLRLPFHALPPPVFASGVERLTTIIDRINGGWRPTGSR